MTAQDAHNTVSPANMASAAVQPALPDYMAWWESNFQDEHAQDEAALPARLNAAAARRVSVLVVDDEQSIADLLAELLESSGYDVFVASNGRTALAIARREHPALVLTDLMMPGVDGSEFVRTLRASPVTNDIPVVMMSSIRPNMKALDNIPFLPKPFDLDDVLDMVKTYAGEIDPSRGQISHH